MPTQVFSANNVHVPAAPPMQLVPTSSGVAVPTGLTSYVLSFDLGGSIPTGQPFAIGAEFQRNAWTDAAGIFHPDGEWLPDASCTTATGSYTTRQGVVTSVHTLGSTVGATGPGGQMVEPYPTHVRIRVDQSGNWTLPNVTFTLN